MCSQQIDVLGPPPSSWWDSWKERNQFFDEHGRPKEGRYVWPPIGDAFEEGVQKYRRESSQVSEFSSEEMSAILDLMRRMLVFRPEERPTAEVLQPEWVVRRVLPELDRR
jgi:serine/threonine-protein kinase SRPK3